MQILRDFFNFIHMAYQSSYLIKSMVIRDLRARYVGSFLGIFWSIIHPLTQIFIYYFIFSVILKIKLGPEYEETDFAIWLVAGLLPWMFFADVVSRSPLAVLEQSSLITKTVFPSEILSFTLIIGAAINHLIGVIIFIGFLVLLGYGISLKIILIIPFFLLTGLLGLGISWLLSALNVFLRDIGQVIGVLVNIWFFLTPIIYPIYLIPEKWQVYYNLNPMVYSVEGYRVGFLGTTIINIEGLTFLMLIGFITFILGGLVFRKLKPSFADVL